MNIPQVCSQCGTPLSVSEMYCSHCGKYVGSDGVDQTQYAANSSYGQPVVPPSYSNPPYGNIPQYEYSTPSQATPPPVSYGMPGANTYPSVGGYPSPGIPSFPQVPQQKKGPNVGLIVGLSILLVVVIGGGLIWAIGSKSSGGTTSQITPVVSTSNAFFSDDFTDNSNGWFVGAQGGYTITAGNGDLMMKETTPDRLLNEPFPLQPPDDAVINVGFTLLSGGASDSMGIILRGNPSNNHHYGYFIEIYGDNSYGISRYHQDPSDATQGKTDFLLHRSTTALKPEGQQNQMSLMLKGSSIGLTLNGRLITTVSDVGNLFPSGRTYFFVSTDVQSSGVEGEINSISVYPTS